MIGLEAYERDPAIPARAGEPELCPPAPAEVVELVGRHLLAPGAAAPRSAALGFARWKPGVSVCAVYRLDFAAAPSAHVCVKRYRGAKAAELVGRTGTDERLAELAAPLLPDRVLPELGLHLWVPAADRELRGWPRLADRGRTKRWLGPLLALPGERLSRRGIEIETLRFKPERRAVARLALTFDLPPPGGARRRVLGARLLPPIEAAHVARARAACADVLAEVGAPALVAVDAAAGILVEDWLELAPPAAVPRAAASSARAEAAGRLAALLHRHSPPAGAPRSLAARKEHQARLDPGLWRAVDPSAGLCGRLERLERALPDHGGRGARPGAERWIHGDLHADQVAPLDGEPGGQPGSFALLDLDALGAGDPLRDLASWLADDVARERSTELLRSAVDDGPFLAGYLRAGGARPEAPALAAAVAAALLRAAAAGLRRLQRGAPGRALELLALAEDLLGVEVAR